tara:strand:+ start:307 stop:600 length:294 start_codon:yes stop_codon:yes gene_type:complete
LKVEDALEIERANLCMNQCHEPSQIIKRVLSSNMKEVSMNIQQCTQKAQIINKETNEQQIDLDKAAVCFETNIQIMHLLSKKLQMGLTNFKGEFMNK